MAAADPGFSSFPGSSDGLGYAGPDRSLAACPLSGLPTPERLEARAVPPENSLWLNDLVVPSLDHSWASPNRDLVFVSMLESHSRRTACRVLDVIVDKDPARRD